MKTIIIIPCSTASKRLPNKPLLAETGDMLVAYTTYAALRSQIAEMVWVAGDAVSVKAIWSWLPKLLVDGEDIRNGTQRTAKCIEAAANFDIVVNLQVDEPLVTGEMLDALIQHMEESPSKIATLVGPIRDSLWNPDTVKVAVECGVCRYFSRAPMTGAMQHIGVYAYRRETLLEIAKLPESNLGRAESLEQLDWLVAGYQIDAVVVDRAPLSINTRADYEQFKQMVKYSYVKGD